MDESRLSLLRALSERYPNVSEAVAEAAALKACLHLPRPTVHVISDVHGEYAKLRHVINNGSGALRPLVEGLFGNELSADAMREFLGVLYYPREAIVRVKKRLGEPDGGAAHKAGGRPGRGGGGGGEGKRREWVMGTLRRQLRVALELARHSRRREVLGLLPGMFRELFEELLGVMGGGAARRGDAYIEAMIDTLAAHGRDFEAVRAASRLIRNLTCAELIVAGDLGDRGPRIDRVIDYLMRQARVSVVWGNHDAAWLGAALGHDACITTVLRFSARYRRAAQLEEGYGILTTALEKLVRDVYHDDPCEHFMPKGEGLRDPLTVARMQKAIAMLQFKAEGAVIRRRPEWGMEHRALLHRIDLGKGTVTIDGVEHALTDRRLPTLDAKNPYEYSKEERECMDRVRESFIGSNRLWEHMSWVVRHGSMWLRRDDALIFHACVPVDEKGEALGLAVDGVERRGRELFDALGSVVRRAYRKGAEGMDEDADWLWYLWGGAKSPLFGKDKLATFESYFVADKHAREEHKNAYFTLLHDAGFARKIGGMFGMGADVLVVNGHVPVKVEKGETPVKKGGNAVTIDGAFSEAYGNRGYTLVLGPERIALAEHHPFDSVEAVLDSGSDIVPKMQTIRSYVKSFTAGESQRGDELRRSIADLEDLVKAYEEGLIAERE